jgi:hypothetical protein
MGKLAMSVDWTQDESDTAPRPFDSGICLKALAPAASPDEDDLEDDTPTRPYERIKPLLAKSPHVEMDRLRRLSVARLHTLVDWLSEGERESQGSERVVAFVRGFLSHIKELDFVIDLLREKTVDAPDLGDVVEAFTTAASVWRANLVDYVDELALTQYRSLDAWSSLHEYSATYVLALISPTLAALKGRMAVGQGGRRAELLPCAWAIESTIVRLNWWLTGTSSRGEGDAAARLTQPAAGP